MSRHPITEADVSRAAGLASLLNVIAHASRMIENMGESRQLGMTNSIGEALDLAADIAEELCITLEQNQVGKGGEHGR